MMAQAPVAAGRARAEPQQQVKHQHHARHVPPPEPRRRRARRGGPCPAPVGRAPVEKVQEAVTAHCARISLVPVPRVDRRKDETELRALLSRCSSLIDGEALVLCSRRHVYKCLECDAVAAVSDQSASEDWGCEHCDAGCKDASLTRVTTERQPQPYIRNLRVRQEAAMAGFFGDLPNGGRGAGYDTPEVDNEGVVVPDIISTLPLDKVAKLSPTSEAIAEWTLFELCFKWFLESAPAMVSVCR